MAGDRALSLLIDIRARDSARGVIASLAGAFPLLIASFRLLGTAANEFASGRIQTGFIALKGGLLGIGEALLKIAALVGIVAVAAAIALGVKAVKAAGDFQQQMIHIQALAGATKQQITDFGNAILAMAPQVGQMPVELAKGLFQIVSSLIPANQQMKALYYSAILASTGMANVVDVSKAMATVMKIFGLTAKEAADQVTVAVTFGRMTMQQYAMAIGVVSLKGQAAGHTFAEVNAALDVLTTHGFPSAQQAARNLGQLFVQMDIGMATLSDRAKKMGLSFDEGTFKTMSLAQQIAYLTKITGGNEGELRKLIGGGVYAFQAFKALQHGAGDYAAILDKLKHAHEGVGAAQLAWAKSQQGFNVQWDKAKAGVQSLLIVLGNKLLPILTQVLTWVTPLITAFAQWVTKTDPLGKAMAWLATAFDKVKTAAIAVWNFLVPIGKFILATLTPVFQLVGKVITNILIPAWNDFVKAIKPWLPDLLNVAKILGIILVAAIITVVGVFLLIIGAVLLVIGVFAALVAAILYAANWVRDKINWLVNVVVGFFVWLWHQLVGGSIIPNIVNGIISWFGKARDFLVGLWNYVIGWIVAQWTKLKNESEVLWDRLVFTIQSKLNQIKQAVLTIIGQAVAWGQNLINNFLAGLQSAWNSVVSWFTGALNGLKSLFPHSPVETGPLQGSENWGYTFGMNLADGMRRSLPAVQSAGLLLASAMGGQYSGSYSLSGSSFAGGRYPSGVAPVVIVNNHNYPPSITLDGAEVTEKIGRRMANEIRRHGGVRNR